jgi:tetratricopeptide (TPR) repeat protein
LLLHDDDDSLGSRADKRARAAKLLERALEADPDSIAAAGRFATVLLEGSESSQRDRLVGCFRAAIVRATSAEAVVMLGSEIARVARDELHDLTVAIDAMRRVRSVAPQHVPSLLMLSELCIALRTWPEAVDALEAVVVASREVGPQMTALFALASIYDKVLSRPNDVERVLRAALALEPANARALRALLRKLAAEASVDPEPHREEIAELLARLAEVEGNAEQKAALLLELADVRARLGDRMGVERALVEAVTWAPDNSKAFARLAAFYKRPEGRDDVAYARALAAVIGLGQQNGRVDPRWLAALGHLEVESLGRVRDGASHLQQAIGIDGSLHESRFELASALSRMGAHDEAQRALIGMITPTAESLMSIADPAAALELLERTLQTQKRPDEAIVVSELRSLAGELDDGREVWIRARRLPPIDPVQAQLDRPTLVTHVLPPEGRHILLEVAAAIAGIESKILRSDLSELGISSRDRVSARSGHPTRALLERIGRQLGVGEMELVIAPTVSHTRVVSQDEPWVVVPPSLVDQPEPIQLVALARAVARIAFGVPWLEEIPRPHVVALLVAAARQVVPAYGADDVDGLSSKLVAQTERNVARALTRRQRKVLEELAPHIAATQGRPPPVDAFVGALVRGELRAGYVLGGDLLSTVEEVRSRDPRLQRAMEAPSMRALEAVLADPHAGDVARWALTSEATALRRGVGSLWSG